MAYSMWHSAKASPQSSYRRLFLRYVGLTFFKLRIFCIGHIINRSSFVHLLWKAKDIFLNHLVWFLLWDSNSTFFPFEEYLSIFFCQHWSPFLDDFFLGLCLLSLKACVLTLRDCYFCVTYKHFVRANYTIILEWIYTDWSMFSN